MKNKVNLFVIGQPKSGTTALYDYLKQHPQLFLPEQKQLYYFATDHNRERKANKKYNRKYYRKYYNYDFNDYISHFDFSTNKLYYCDITPDYFYSQTAVEGIYNYNPNARILLILREPLQFLKSFHNQMINSGCENILDFWKAFERGIDNERRTEAISCPQLYLNYHKLVNYMEFLKPWVEKFGDNLRIVLYEDFKKDNFKVLQFIYNYLGVIQIDYEKKILSNISKKPDLSIKRKILNLYFFRYISSLIPIKLKHSLKKVLTNSETIKNNHETHTSINKEKEDKFKQDLREAIIRLDTYCLENDLYLLKQKGELINIWKYV